MIKEAIGVGETIEEAKEDAIAKLNAKYEDDIQFDVLATPKKRVLGLFGGSKAEVKAFVEVPDEKPEKPKKAAKRQPDKQKPAEKQTAKAKPEKTAIEKKKAPQIPEDFSDAVPADALASDSQAARAVEYLKKILKEFGCEGTQIRVAERQDCAYIMLEGEGLGAIIGHRGETLDSLQYLVGLAANGAGGYYKVSLNIGDYRERREQTLIALAQRMSEQVLRTGKNRTLEPMNPYERRIIHTAVQEIDGVVSNSFGEGSARRVVISPEGGDPRPQRREGGRPRSGGRDRNRRPSNKVEAPAREPKKDSDMPLYGKIN